MKYEGYDSYILDEDEPALRSCWECNGAHEHLKNVSFLHFCFECNRHWIHGRFLESFGSEAEMDEFLKAHLTPLAIVERAAEAGGLKTCDFCGASEVSELIAGGHELIEMVDLGDVIACPDCAAKQKEGGE